MTAFSGSLNALEQRLALASRTLDAVSPLATLGRGFAVVSRVDDGALLRDAAQAPAGTEIEARLAKGRLRATRGLARSRMKMTNYLARLALAAVLCAAPAFGAERIHRAARVGGTRRCGHLQAGRARPTGCPPSCSMAGR